MPGKRNFRDFRTQGAAVVDGDGTPVLLRGVGLGGWMNMENFITGYPATESQMRAAVAGVLGRQRAERFFDRLLARFFEGEGAATLFDESYQPKPAYFAVADALARRHR